MIKAFFKILFALLILTLLSPFIVLGLMYRGNADAAIPTEDYIDDVNVEAVIAEEIETVLSGLETPGEDIVLSLSDATINAMIYAFLSGENGVNPDYQPGEDCEGDACAFFSETFDINQNATGTLRLTGAWVEFVENQIRLNLNASMQYNDGFTYATQVRLDVTIEDQEDQYYLALDRVSLGRLPITQTFFNRVLGWVESATDQSLENPDTFPVGTLDLSTLSLTIPKAEIITQIEEDPELENGETFATLLGLVFDNDLLTFALASGTLDVTLQSSLLFNEGPLVLDPAIESVYEDPSGFDPTTSLSGLLESFLLTAALSERNELVVDEVLLNQVLAQNLAQNEALAFTQTFAGIDGTITELRVSLDRLFVDLTPEGMQLVLALSLNDAPSIVRLTLNEMSQIDPLSLTYEVTRMTIGEDASEDVSDYLSLDDVTPLLNTFKDQVSTAAFRINDQAQIILDASILTASLESSLAAGGVELEGLNAEADALILNLAFDASITGIIDAYGDALNAFLEDDLSVLAIETVMSGFPSDEADEFVDALNVLSDEITTGTPSAESVDQFINAYTQLSGTEKTALTANLKTFIESSIIDEFEGVLPE